MREIRPGLRVINKTNDVAKVSLVVPAGDELEVSEDVAAQIAAQSTAFVGTDSPDAEKAVPYPPPVEGDAEPVDEKPKPVKRAVKKAATK